MNVYVIVYELVINVQNFWTEEHKKEGAHTDEKRRKDTYSSQVLVQMDLCIIRVDIFGILIASVILITIIILWWL